MFSYINSHSPIRRLLKFNPISRICSQNREKKRKMLFLSIAVDIHDVVTAAAADV
jgi:hypothetical protein